MYVCMLWLHFSSVLDASRGGKILAFSLIICRAQRAAAILELAIERGVPRFNAGDEASCAALYELAIASVVLLGDDCISPSAKADLAEALEKGAEHADASERAWIYRRAMDRALDGVRASRTQAE